MSNFKNRSIAGTFALVATMITVAAATPLRAETPSVKVAYGDLNVRSEAGVATLNSRIQRAAAHVCTDHVGNRIEEATCRNHAVASARSQIALIRTTDVQLAAR